MFFNYSGLYNNTTGYLEYNRPITQAMFRHGMKIFRNCLCFISIACALFFSSSAHATPKNALPINWQQDSINWDQLQTIFRQNQDVNNFNITFPNGLAWDVDASIMRAMRQAYMHHAQVIGYKIDEIPEMNFSSIEAKYKTNKIMSTIPIEKFADNLQMGEMDMLNELDNEKNGVWQSLPEWLQKFLSLIWDGMVNFWGYITEQATRIFR